MQGKFTLRSLLLAVGIVAAGVAAACSDQGTLVGPTDAPDAGPSFAIQGSAPGCEIITFDDLNPAGLIPNAAVPNGDLHGYSIPPAYPIEIFDFTVNLTLVRGDGIGAANQNPVLFNTGRMDRIWEEDIQYNPVADPGTGLGFAECNDAVNGPRDGATNGFNPATGGGLGPGGFPDCANSGHVVIVEDDQGIQNEGNDSQGGTFTLGPFTAPGEFFFQSIDILDNGDLTEVPVEIKVGAVTVGASTGLGNGTVEKVMATVTENLASGSLVTVQLGSGAIDNIEICRRLGGEGCTPGYWKQPHHFDSWPLPYTPDTLFCDVFECAFPGMTLLQVLRQGGGGLNALGRHTVAALLNAASGGVDYDLFPGEVISEFNAVYPGSRGAYNALKDRFEGFNEQGCPLN